jgi:SOS-response transcriptional repressor LexA
MTRHSLTRRERQVLDFIRECLDSGISPSLGEIAKHIGFRAKSQAFKVVKSLERKRRLLRPENDNRTLVLVDQDAITVTLPPELDGEVRNLALIGKCSPEAVVIEAVRDGLKAYHAASLARRAKLLEKTSL